MSESIDDSQSLFIYSTTVSDIGYVRSDNQDSSFAGQRLIAMCDGMGGHAGGDTASTIAVRSLAHIEHDDQGEDAQRLSQMMEASVIAAHDAIVGKAKREHRLSGMGTTVTAVALAGGFWVLAHIGDSRAYLLRDGRLLRITQDHSYVQHLINTGRIAESEAKSHPQRNVVMRVLGDFDIDPRPDISMRKAQPGDRWMLCSDGLCGVLEDPTISEALSSVPDQGECAQRLVTMALKAGSTDNVTVVIGDATLRKDASALDLPRQTPLIGGAASANLEALADIVHEPVAAAPKLRESASSSPAQRAAALTQSAQDGASDATPDQGKGPAHGPAPDQLPQDEPQRMAQPSSAREESGDRDVPDTGEIPIVRKEDGSASADPYDPDVAKAIRKEHTQRRKRQRVRKRRVRLIIVAAVLALLALLSGGAYGAYYWSQQQYYLGEDRDVVAIYQGVPTNVFGLSLSHPVERTDIELGDLPSSWREQLQEGITVSNYDQAREHADLIRRESRSFKQGRASKETKLSEKKSSASASAKPASPTKPAASASTGGSVIKPAAARSGGIL
ncbi:Protein phosphatase 2C [Bifidobacterium actinocoloniiforme DSM 22766]|uniref:Protein phosphatase 2C n=1 Tax=Bifidobacterium actinocoloniiforme DSM 22766 TaxID=1437605 RepID=A0A086YWE4_9BIFI|nr:protein phosphatase 2C domain-containing protein [Bifidobacterium actinocoloniiforme]AKV55793.1 phosphoprotein phosphatase [Bifidobacterium actinocoloniiforme DSM 22766]KFI38594.1 Protein phosphatase 2C [Bifidobacterium actinocoloniiforme DSM 22766]